MDTPRPGDAGETGPTRPAPVTDAPGEDAAVAAREAYVEAVLSMVESIPEGKVAAYGDIAERVGSGGPRQVGRVMSLYGATVPWWRVLRTDGRPARGLEDEALARLREEDVPIRGDRVVMSRARWLDPIDPPS